MLKDHERFLEWDKDSKRCSKDHLPWDEDPKDEGHVLLMPISTKNTYPHGRVRVFTGKGMGSPKNTQGFPVPITTSCQHINSCTTSSSAMFSLMFWLTSITGPITSHILEPYTLKMVLKSYVSPCLSLGGRRLTHFVSQPGLLHTGCKKE